MENLNELSYSKIIEISGGSLLSGLECLAFLG